MGEDDARTGATRRGADIARTRRALIARLEELVRSPETLLDVPAGELLDALARDYRGAIEAFVAPAEAPPRGGPGAAGLDASVVTEQRVERGDDARVTLDLGDGAAVAVVDPRTRALIEDVPNLLTRLVRLRDPTEASWVRQALHDELYMGLPEVDDGVLSELLHLIVALLRAADARDPGSRGANANLFAQLRRDYTETRRIYVHGMARAHEPEHGRTWSDDADHWVAALEANLRPAPRPHTTTSHEPTSEPRAREGTKAEDDGGKALDAAVEWPARFGWADRHVEFLGAREDKELLGALGELTAAGRLQWTPLSRDDQNMRRVQALAARIEAGGVDLVVVFTAFASHKATSLIKASLRKRPRVKVLWTAKLPSLSNLLTELSGHPEAHL